MEKGGGVRLCVREGACVRVCVAYRVRHAVAGVEHDAGGAAGRVEGEHGLDGDVPAVGSLVEGQSCFLDAGLVDGLPVSSVGFQVSGDAHGVWCLWFGCSGFWGMSMVERSVVLQGSV